MESPDDQSGSAEEGKGKELVEGDIGEEEGLDDDGCLGEGNEVETKLVDFFEREG